MLDGQIDFAVLVLGVLVGIYFIDKTVDFIVKLIHQARLAIQFMIVISIMSFFAIISIAPEEAGQVVRLLVKLVDGVIGAMIVFLEIITEEKAGP